MNKLSIRDLDLTGKRVLIRVDFNVPLSKDTGDDGEALGCLLGYAGVIVSDGAGSGDHDVAADTDGSGEADDGLVGRCAGDVLSGGSAHSADDMRVQVGYDRLKSAG